MIKSVNAYFRGPDLSGSLEGAGGIGGLLARSHGYSAGTWSTHNYYHADGGGNITALLDNHATVAATSATYRYDPYGRLLSSDGGMAAANTYRFSSKEVHPNSGLYYYGFRFYDPTLQRWLNRDPIFEFGGVNLYGFVGNNPIGILDAFGLIGGSEGITANINACARNSGEIGNLARELTDQVAADAARRAHVQAAVKALKATPRAARNALDQALPGTGPAHHLATLQSRANPVAQRAAQGGFNWNSANNGFRMPEWMHKGYQAWHREWNKFLNDLMKHAPDMSPEDAARWLQGIVDAERARLADCMARGVLPAVP